jgi:hypothetical protein
MSRTDGGEGFGRFFDGCFLKDEGKQEEKILQTDQDIEGCWVSDTF